MKQTRNHALAEALNARQLLSGEPYITYNSANKTVTLNGSADGSNAADLVTVDRVGANLLFSIDLGSDGATGPYTAQYGVSAVNSTIINTGDGNDTLTIRSGRAFQFQSGTGNDQLTVTRIDAGQIAGGSLGDGNDSLYLGSDGTLDLIDGIPSMTGGNGIDTLYLDDQLSSGTAYEINGSYITRDGISRIWYPTYLDKVVLQLSDLGTNVTLSGFSTIASVQVEGGVGDDVLTLASSLNTISNFDGSLHFNGNGGTNLISFNDAGNIAESTNYSITSASLGRSGMTPVTYSGTNVALMSGPQADTISIALDTPLNLNIDAGGQPSGAKDRLNLATSVVGPLHFAADAASGTWTLPLIGSVTYTHAEEVLSPLLVQSSRFDRDALTIEIDFAGDVGATLDLNDLSLRNAASTVIPVESFTWDATAQRARFITSSLTPLPDGDYTATLATTFNDGAASIPAPYTLGFSMLRGDLDLDDAVDFDDLLILAQNYGLTGRTYTQGNLDYSADGLVGFDDLLLLAQRYGQTAATGNATRKTTRRISDSVLG